MNEYKIYLDVLDGNCKYIIRLKKYDYYHSEEWEFKVYDNKIVSLNTINVYD